MTSARAMLTFAMAGKTDARRRKRASVQAARDSEIDWALDAMTAPELRAAMRVVLAELDEDAQASALETLVARASKGTTGWRPTSPSPRIVAEDARSPKQRSRSATRIRAT